MFRNALREWLWNSWYVFIWVLAVPGGTAITLVCLTVGLFAIGRLFFLEEQVEGGCNLIAPWVALASWKSGNKLFVDRYDKRTPEVGEGLLFAAWNLVTQLIWVGAGYGVLFVTVALCLRVSNSSWFYVLGVLGCLMAVVTSLMTWHLLQLWWWPLPPEPTPPPPRGRVIRGLDVGLDVTQQLANQNRRRV
jgi:hypothetical protein